MRKSKSSYILAVTITILILIVIMMFSQKSKCTEHYWTWNQTCFTPESLVMMADGSEKPIADIRQGDWIASGKSLQPTLVHFVMKHSYSGRLVALNDTLPFVTANHSFLTLSEGGRVAVDAEASHKGNREHVEPLLVGETLVQVRDGSRGGWNVNKIQATPVNNVPVVNLFTDDGTFIVNRLCVYDEFPDITKHVIVARRIAFMMIQRLMCPEKPIQAILKAAKLVDMKDFRMEQLDMNKLRKIVGLNETLVAMAHQFWLQYFDDLTEHSVERVERVEPISKTNGERVEKTICVNNGN